MRTLLITTLLTLSLSAPDVTAQDVTAQDVTAQDEQPVQLLRGEIAGPAAWHARLRPTNLGTLLASAEGEAQWRPWAEQLGGMLHGMLGADGAAVPQAWLEYGGTVEVVLLGRAGASEGEARMSGRVSFGADGDRDVQALATSSLRLCAGALGLEFAPAFEGSDLAVARRDDWIVTMPKVAGGRSTVYFGNDQPGVRRLLAAELPAVGAKPTPQTPLLDVSFDLQASERLRVASGGREQSEMVALGFACLRTLQVTVGAHGPHVQGELGLTFADGERGLFAGLFPARAGVPDLFWAIPPEARAWKVGHLDAMAIWHAVLRAMAEDDSSPEAKAAEIREETGVDIGKDVLAHLTDEAMLSWHPRRVAEGEQADELAICLAMRVRDEAAFKAGFGKLVKSGGEMELREVDGILRVDQERAWFIPPISFAVGKGIALVTVGERAPAQVDAVLAQAGRAAAMPKEFEVPGRSAPAGWNGVGVVEAGILVRHYLPAFFDVLELPGGTLRSEMADAMDQGILPLFAKQHLDRVLTMTGCTGTAWRFRILW